MITYAELFALLVFGCMAGYIMYLQHQLSKAMRAGELLTMILHDIACGEVEIERTDDGIRIIKDNRQASPHKC
jgi:hypothetical protein